jgi:4-alpha-glucanotransferase
LRDAEQIDWPRSGAVKLRWLRALFDLVEAGGGTGQGARWREWLERFGRYRAEQGEPLERHACFEALHAFFMAQGLSDWRQWPPRFRDPASPEVADFARAQAVDVRFHVFLQWLADAGLAQAQQAARDAGMAIGLVSDLAVGMDGGGSHAWAHPGDLLSGLEVGAPPDLLNTQGQTWGLTALSPRALIQSGFAPFLSTLRAAMRHAGGVRIDHVLGLKRLWLVPQGAPAGEGAYLHYPLDDLLNLVALESHRHRAIVIGEDLGTVPHGLREQLADLGIMGMRVLWFERDPMSGHGAGFLPPGQWPRDAVALTATHDLATAAGWWLGRDIDWRERIGIGGDVASSRAERARDRAALLRACAGRSDDPATVPPDTAVDLAIDQVAATPASLAIVPLEDLLGLVEQPNLPGTVDEHPNWRRRLPLPADGLLAEPPALRRVQRLRQWRGLKDAP